MLSSSRLRRLSLGSSERPSTVWRVVYSGNAGFELSPRGGEVDFADANDFHAQRHRHVTWDRSLASPFVSVFSNKDHAIRWGNRMGAVFMYEIRARGLPLMFRSSGADECLVLGAIPRGCVVRSLQVEVEVARLRRHTAFQRLSRSARPTRTYYPEADGWYENEDDARDAIDENHLLEYMMNH